MKYKNILIFLILTLPLHAQVNNDKLPTQFSPFLSKAYYNFNFGAITHHFSNDNLLEGYSSSAVKSNKFSGRFLIGYKFREDFAIQYGVMRAAKWFKYININDENIDRTVWINMWSLSLKKDFKLYKKLAIYGELGIGNLARKGFTIGDDTVLPNAHYATALFGAGFKYKLNHEWDLLLNATYLAANKKQDQPYVFQSSVGMLYNLRQIERKKAEAYANDATYFFPKRFIQLGYATSNVGFFTNRLFSSNVNINGKRVGIPIFWHGNSKAANTFSISYQQTAFHTEKLFSLDWGVSLTGFQTMETGTNAYALSVFPVMRFYVLRKKPLDLYLDYSVIGPTYLSEADLDGLETGPKITYQDYMGLGAFVGKNRNLNFEVRIMHYSNGNIFNKNVGVAIPLVFNIGMTL
jgi:hypothetical protein